MRMCVCLYVCICVWADGVFRELSSLCVPHSENIYASENIFREHSQYQHYTTDWSQDVPGKFWEKFSEYMFYTPFV